MEKELYIKDEFESESKYLLKEEYGGFGLYQTEKTSGYFTNQDWLISNNDVKLIVPSSYTRESKEKIFAMIDKYNSDGKFGEKAILRYDLFCLHSLGRISV